MPRVPQFSKNDIAEKALLLIKENGIEAVTARNLGKLLGCSSSPIFTVFNNMDEVIACAREVAEEKFNILMADVTDYMPAFKEFGVRLINFAREEGNIFNFLFISKDASSNCANAIAKRSLQEIAGVYNFTDEQIDILFRQMWPFACGIAMMVAQNPMLYTDEQIKEMLSYQFASLMGFILSKREVVNIEPHIKTPGADIRLKL